MNPMGAVVGFEFFQLAAQIDRIPEELMIQRLATNRPDEPFDEGMGNPKMWDGLEFFDLQYPQVGKPAVKSKQRVVIRAQILRLGLTSRGPIEPPAHGYPLDMGHFNTKTNDPTREDVQDHSYPVAA